MKYIVLSFDDARGDFYTRVYPLLIKYGFRATLNVTSGFVINPQNFNFPSGNNIPMTPAQIIEVNNSGVEIACHGSMHLNTSDDLRQNIKELNDFGISTKDIGFASPTSLLTKQNINDYGIWSMISSKEISYIRTGIRIRREGYIYTLVSLIDKYLHSRILFNILNRRNIIRSRHSRFFPSVTILCYTTNSQIKYFINSIPDDSSAILMFHSILYKTDLGYGKDKFFWDIVKFEELLKYLNSQKDIIICTNKELMNV